MSKPLLNNRQGRQPGSSLIEALVALLVLSVGMLMVMRTLTQSIAVISDGLNQQRAAFTLNNLTESLLDMPAELLRAFPAAANYACADGGVCTPEQLLADRLHYWQTHISRQLPAGTGSVHIDTLGDQEVVRASVSWLASDNQAMQHTSYVALPADTGAP
jgi:Tfp pilus assembly protein PilV